MVDRGLPAPFPAVTVLCVADMMLRLDCDWQLDAIGGLLAEESGFAVY